MQLIIWSQALVFFALSAVGFGIQVWAFTDCIRRNKADFERTMKRTKGFWLGITGAAVAVGFLSTPWGTIPSLLAGGGPMGAPLPIFLQVIAVTASCVYLADVRPAIKEVQGTPGNSGPYGPW